MMMAAILGACILSWYINVALTSPMNFLLPKWTQTISDDNLTDIPKFITKLENSTLYPARVFLQNMFSSQYHRVKASNLQRTQNRLPKSSKFFCNTNGTRSLTRPASVHELRPGDIDIIGGIGDSLSAGTGSFAYILPQVVVDHRGVSWTSGGQGTWKEYLTLPNILKVFNPKLIGFAYGDSVAGQRFSQFNVAEPGALSRDLPFMTKELVKRIKMDKRVNLNEDWKMITMMMGSNTLCLELCYEDSTKSAEKHRIALNKSLLYIKEHLPRTIVNLVVNPNLETLLNIPNLPSICFLTQIAECPCFFALQHKKQLPDYMKTMKQFQEVEKEIVETEEMKNKDDFSVVLQPFTKDIKLPMDRSNNIDLSYMAADCFHFTQKGYARAANALWNNLIEPVGRKSTNWLKEFDRFLCPTDEFPFIRTWKNSMT